MKLNAFGRRIEVVREGDAWMVYDLGEGKKRKAEGIFIPPDCFEDEVVLYLEDLLHELATPDRPKITVPQDS